MVQLLVDAIRPEAKLVHVPPSIGIVLGKLIGLFTRDLILTRAELRGLMENLLTSPQAPNGATRFTEWLERNRETVGLAYASELERHFRWIPAEKQDRGS